MPVEVVRKRAIASVSSDETNGLGVVAMCQRNAEARGHRQGRRDPWDHLDNNAVRFEFGNFLARASEDHRVAGLQADDAFALPRQGYHESIDVALGAAVSTAPFADDHPFGFAPRQLEDLTRNEIVKQDDVGRLQCPHGLQREQLGVARAGADQRHTAPGCRISGCRFVDQRFDRVVRLGVGSGAERAICKALPEPAARWTLFQSIVHFGADVAGDRCPCGKRRREECLDAAPDGLAENRCAAVGRNSDDDRRPIDDRAELELAKGGPVDDVHRHTGAAGRAVKGLCFGIRFRVGKRDGRMPKDLDRPGARVVHEATWSRAAHEQFGHFRAHVWRIDLDMRTGRGE